MHAFLKKEVVKTKMEEFTLSYLPNTVCLPSKCFADLNVKKLKRQKKTMS